MQVAYKQFICVVIGLFINMQEEANKIQDLSKQIQDVRL